jgi:hypothetical protein
VNHGHPHTHTTRACACAHTTIAKVGMFRRAEGAFARLECHRVTLSRGLRTRGPRSPAAAQRGVDHDDAVGAPSVSRAREGASGADKVDTAAKAAQRAAQPSGAAVSAAVRARRLTEPAAFNTPATALLLRKTEVLPEWLRDAMVEVTTHTGLPRKRLRADCVRLHDFLFTREVVSGVDPEVGVRQGAAATKYAPQLHYGPREALAHLASRGPMCYGAAATVLAEVGLRLPWFAPADVLDFGAGAGCATLAAAERWPATLRTATCVDSSSDAADISQRLFDAVREHRIRAGSDTTADAGINRNGCVDGNSDDHHAIDHLRVHHRAMLPGVRQGEAPPYGIVTASFALCELPDARMRRSVRICTPTLLANRRSGVVGEISATAPTNTDILFNALPCAQMWFALHVLLFFSIVHLCSLTRVPR